MSFQSYRRCAAKKPHKCDECGTKIAVGERYVRIVGINIDGDFGTWHSHEDCELAAKELNDLADYSYDEYLPLGDHVWELDGEGLIWLRTAHPVTFARFAEALAKHGRLPAETALADGVSRDATKANSGMNP